MPDELACARGHRWEQPPGFPDPAMNVCPVCGGQPLSTAPPVPWPPAAKAWLVWFIVLGVISLILIFVGVLYHAQFGFMWIVVTLPLAWLVSLAIWGSWYMERKRMLAMAETCKLMNFSFTEVLPKKQLPELGGFALFKRGHSHKAHNLMAGQVGGEDVLLFDYRYITGHGKHQQTHNQTVVLLPGVATGLPDFQIAPATFMDKLGKLFGAKSIDFPDTPEFSKQYRLTGLEDEVRPLFTNEVRAHFRGNPGWAMETRDGDMLIYRNAKRAAPESCPELIADTLIIRNLFAPPETAPVEEESPPVEPEAQDESSP
jgi:hypothetical protein